MDKMNFKIHCILVVFTFYVQEGLSRDYEANLGANILLQVYFTLLYFYFFSVVRQKSLKVTLYCFLKHTPLKTQAELMEARGKCKNMISKL